MFEKIKSFSNLVVLPHSVYALPFALASLLVATQGKPPLRTLLWVLVCMVLARTAAMAYNRLIDADIDALNPRTRNREIPSGIIKPWQARTLTLFCGLGFVAATSQLNALAFKLSPLALGIIFFYSYTKRFTWLSHFFLGLALGVAPVGAWVAATGQLAFAPFWLTAAVICFLAGFDILYATQDEAFDKSHGLQSWVVRWGVPNSLKASRFLHIGMLGFLAGFGVLAGFSKIYVMGVALMGVILIYQHQQVALGLKENGEFTLSPDMMKMNGWIAVLYFAVVGVSIWFSKGF
jgi:4-hydroxybenzoate polyprenyltransferase